MTEEFDERFVCTSAWEVAKFFGVAERTVAYWKRQGMPHVSGGGGKRGTYFLGPIVRWWRERQGDSETPPKSAAVEASPVVHDAIRQAGFRALERDWESLIPELLSDASRARLLGELPMSVEDLVLNGNLHAGGDEYATAAPCGGGPSAIRIAKTRVYIWAEMQKDFAAALVRLVNSGRIEVVPAADPPCQDPEGDSAWGHFLDLPRADDWTNPPRTDSRFPLAFACGVVDPLPVQLEVVNKPKLRLSDRVDFRARESALMAIGNFEGLWTAAEKSAWLDAVETEVKKHRKRR